YRTVRGRPGTQLAGAVVPPAIGGAARRDPADELAHGEGGEGGPSRTHRRKRESAGHGDRCRTVRGRAVTQLADGVVPPAIGGAARRDSARRIRRGRKPGGAGAPRTHGRKREPAGHGDRCRTVRRRAVTQLAVSVEPPTIHTAARG